MHLFRWGKWWPGFQFSPLANWFRSTFNSKCSFQEAVAHIPRVLAFNQAREIHGDHHWDSSANKPLIPTESSESSGHPDHHHTPLARLITISTEKFHVTIPSLHSFQGDRTTLTFKIVTHSHVRQYFSNPLGSSRIHPRRSFFLVQGQRGGTEDVTSHTPHHLFRIFDCNNDAQTPFRKTWTTAAFCNCRKWLKGKHTRTIKMSTRYTSTIPSRTQGI